MIEFKVVKTTHKRSGLGNRLAYAIISTSYFRAEPDADRGVHLDDEDDMFIIAYDMNDAHEMLVDKIYENGF